MIWHDNAWWRAPVVAASLTAVIAAPALERLRSPTTHARVGVGSAEQVIVYFDRETWPTPPTWRQIGRMYFLSDKLLAATMGANTVLSVRDCPKVDSPAPVQVVISLSEATGVVCPIDGDDHG